MLDSILSDGAGLSFAASGGPRAPASTRTRRASEPWKAGPARWHSGRGLLLALFALAALAGCGDRRIVFCNAASADVDNGGCGATGGAGGATTGGTGGAAGGGGTSGSGGGAGTVSQGGSGGSAGSPVDVGGSGGAVALDASVVGEDSGLDAGDAAAP